eukprot:gene7450-24943_t
MELLKTGAPVRRPATAVLDREEWNSLMDLVDAKCPL